MQQRLPRVLVQRHLLARPARRPGRPEAGAAADPLRDGRAGPAPDRGARQVGPRRRRGHGQVPPARRHGDLRRPRADGPAVHAAAALIDGHGNFGSLDDGPAAARYTEARLAPAALLMVAGLDEDIVDFVPNYDDSLTQPGVHARGQPQPARQRRRRASPSAWRRTWRRTTSSRSSAPRATSSPTRTARSTTSCGSSPGPTCRGGRDHRARRHPRRLPDRSRQLPHARDGARREAHPTPQGHRRHRAALPRRAREGHREGQGCSSSPRSSRHRRRQGPHGPPARPAAGLEVKNGFNPEAVLEQLTG